MVRTRAFGSMDSTQNGMELHMQANATIREGSGNGGQGHGSPWRPVVWGAAAMLELLPLLAMQFTREVNWTGFDFLVFGIMLLVACATFELGLRMSNNTAYRAGMGLAALAGFLLVWINLAVGVIGDEDNPANLMFAAVLLTGGVLALAGKFRARAMVRALVATAVAQAIVGVVVIVGALGDEAIAVCAVFALLWLTSALLFRVAAKQSSD